MLRYVRDMEQDLVGDFPNPPWSTLLRRGFTKRCPRCASKEIFSSYFHMLERCPNCGIKFEREPGFFVGVYLVNFAAILVLLFIETMAFIPWKIANPDTGVAIPIAIGIVASLIVPIILYPFARTIWSAFDLGGTPVEQAEADQAAEALKALNSKDGPTKELIDDH